MLMFKLFGEYAISSWNQKFTTFPQEINTQTQILKYELKLYQS